MNLASNFSGLKVLDPLRIGVVLSLLFHGLVLSIQFRAPEPLVFKPEDSQLEVVLLNAGTQTTPLNPDVLAQISSEGGGDRDRGRAKSPLIASDRANDGDDLIRRKAQVEQLEIQQRQLLALATQNGPADPTKNEGSSSPKEAGVDPTDTQALIARMQAEISKQIDDYNKRPKRLTFGVNAQGVSFAEYVDTWARKMEEIGTARFPAEAKGRYYDSLIVTAEIDKHGNVVNVIFNQKSKYEVLNKAARQTIYAGQPYDKFPPEMARQADILQIVRTWYFTRDDSISVEVVKP